MDEPGQALAAVPLGSLAPHRLSVCLRIEHVAGRAANLPAEWESGGVGLDLEQRRIKLRWSRNH